MSGKEDAFTKTCDKAELPPSRGELPPFLSIKKLGENGWIIGLLTGAKVIECFAMVKGKASKTKKVKKEVFDFMVEDSDGKTEAGAYTIDPPGLLRYQFGKKLEAAGGKYPVRLAIRYLGQDDEERHQTEVR